jgi:hypothetical protein
MALDFSDAAISKALEDVRNGTDGINWALFGFVPKSLTKIRVDGTGSDGLSECAEDFSEGKVQYAYLRYSIKNTNKFVYIAWLGSAVTGMLKGSFNNTVVDMANFIKKGNPIHVQINARSEIDLDEEKIKEKLVKAVGSNYDAGAVKQGVSEGIKNVTQGKKIHQEEISKANQTSAVGDSKLEFNKDASAKFWQQDRAQPTPPGKPQQTKAQIDEEARKKYWEEQKKREEEEKRAAQAKAQQPRGPAAGGSVKGRFEAAQKSQTQAPPPKPVTSTPKKVSTAAFTAPASSAPPKVNNTPKPVSQVAPPAPKPVEVAKPPPKPEPPKPPVVKKPEPVPEPEPTYQEEYAQEEYGEEYAQEEYGQEYGQEEYAQEEYAQEEYGQEYAEEQHGQEEYAQEEYAQEEYAQEEYGQEEYAQEEYAQEEYAQEEYQEEGSGGQRVVALYDYDAAQEGDLSFKAGEYITITDTSDPGGWWRGYSDDGREGVFPSNFVQQ